jgi:hypothetical protein
LNYSRDSFASLLLITTSVYSGCMKSTFLLSFACPSQHHQYQQILSFREYTREYLIANILDIRAWGGNTMPSPPPSCRWSTEVNRKKPLCLPPFCRSPHDFDWLRHPKKGKIVVARVRKSFFGDLQKLAPWGCI